MEAIGQLQATLYIVCNIFEGKNVSVRTEKVPVKGSWVKELVVDLRGGK